METPMIKRGIAESKAGTTREMGNLMKNDIDKWATVIKRASIEQQ